MSESFGIVDTGFALCSYQIIYMIKMASLNFITKLYSINILNLTQLFFCIGEKHRKMYVSSIFSPHSCKQTYQHIYQPVLPGKCQKAVESTVWCGSSECPFLPTVQNKITTFEF